MAYKTIQVKTEGRVGVITFSRPEALNALCDELTTELATVLAAFEKDGGIGCVVLTGSKKAFAAGADIKELQARDFVGLYMHDPFAETWEAVARFRKPIIAAMTGSLMAGGMMLSLNSDLRFGLRGARVGITEVKIGRGSPWAAPALTMLPQPILMEIVLTGDLMPIERLHEYGFTNYLEDTPDAVRARACELAKRVASGAPLSVIAAKASVRATMDLGCEAGLEEGKRLHEVVYASQDAIEGPRAFAEKRAPVWQGR